LLGPGSTDADDDDNISFGLDNAMIAAGKQKVRAGTTYLKGLVPLAYYLGDRYE
jgi:hypothetical protein